MTSPEGAFRFTYFTEKYKETCDFYEHQLAFELEHSWDRSDHDKGALFKAERGFIEVLFLSDNAAHRNAGLDYRTPQGVFMCIQTSNVDELFKIYKQKKVPFKQEITDQTWGHKSFSIIEPNGLVLFFFQEQF